MENFSFFWDYGFCYFADLMQKIYFIPNGNCQNLPKETFCGAIISINMNSQNSIISYGNSVAGYRNSVAGYGNSVAGYGNSVAGYRNSVAGDGNSIAGDGNSVANQNFNFQVKCYIKITSLSIIPFLMIYGLGAGIILGIAGIHILLKNPNSRFINQLIITDRKSVV